MQRQRSQRRALAQVTSKEFRRQMLCVGGAAAVAKEQCLVAGPVGCDERIGRSSQRREAGLHKAGMHFQATLRVAAKNVDGHDHLPHSITGLIFIPILQFSEPEEIAVSSSRLASYTSFSCWRSRCFSLCAG